MSEAGVKQTGKGGARCPICARPTVSEFRPFCCKRCADVDLQRWLSGRYAVSSVEDEKVPDAEPFEDE